MKALIITEGGKNIGFGHITRCLSLADALKEKDVLPEFIIDGDRSVTGLLRGERYKVFDWIKNPRKLLDRMRNIDIVIVDSYSAKPEFYKNVSIMAKKPLYIDDNKRLDYPRGVVVNGNLYAHELGYPHREDIVYLLGTEYIPLRREFWQIPVKETKRDIENILITFGGDDSRNMTPKVLKVLVREYPSLKKTVICGAGFKNIDEIKGAKDKKTKMIYSPDTIQLKEEFLESDIAISAGGQTLYEFASIGLPAIVIAVVENQLNNIKGWQRRGFVRYAGWWEKECTWLYKIPRYIDELRDRMTREKMSDIGRRLVDGRGSIRVCDILLCAS